MRKYVLSASRLGLATVMGGLMLWRAEAAVPISSVPVKLAWSAADDASVAGYAVYFGPMNQPATNRVDVGANLSVTFYRLVAGVGYRFYAVSYNNAGVESVPSNQLFLTPTALSRMQIAPQPGGGVTLTLRAAPDTLCAVQYSAKPTGVPWQTLTTVRADANGNIVVTDPTAGTVAARFYRAAMVSAAPALSRLQIAALTNGSVQLSLSAVPGTSCRLQYAAKPQGAAWQTLTNVTADSSGRAIVVDASARQSAMRFYRGVTP
jgi:hypothetical protein